jgi:hypothetical protein
MGSVGPARPTLREKPAICRPTALISVAPHPRPRRSSVAGVVGLNAGSCGRISSVVVAGLGFPTRADRPGRGTLDGVPGRPPRIGIDLNGPAQTQLGVRTT